jgi:hypothetical protein
VKSGKGLRFVIVNEEWTAEVGKKEGNQASVVV